MSILKLNPISLALILFVPSLVQIITGWGIIVNGFTIGLMPGLLIYLFWLLLLTLELGDIHVKKMKGRVVRLLITIFIVAPFYWFMLNEMMKRTQLGELLLPIGGPIFFWGIFVFIDTWIFLSKTIYFINNKPKLNYEAIGFGSYKNFFWYFVGGIFTIWWLQPAIVRSVTSVEQK